MMDRFLPEEVLVARIELGINLREAAKRTGLTKETISDIERGIRMPHPQTLKKIAEGYGVPISQFLKTREEAIARPKSQAPILPEPPPEEVSEEERRDVKIRRLLSRAGIEDSKLGLDEGKFNDLVADIPLLAAEDLKDLTTSTRHDYVTVVGFVSGLPDETPRENLRKLKEQRTQAWIVERRMLVALSVYEELIKREAANLIRDLQKEGAFA